MPNTDVASTSQHRGTAVWFVGYGLSVLGDGALALAAGVWVRSLTGSDGLAAWTTAASYAAALLTPVGGVLVDRVGARRALLVANLVAAAMVVALLGVRGSGQVWLVIVVSLCVGLTNVVADPAEMALIGDLGSEGSDTSRLMGARAAVQECCRIIAPLVGAGLFATVGGHGVAVIDAATFVVAALVLTVVRVRPATRAHESEGVLSDLREGWRCAFDSRQLRLILFLAGAPMALVGLAIAARYNVVAQGLHRSPAFLGVLVAAMGAGSIVGAVLAGKFGQGGRREIFLAAAGAALFAVGGGLCAVGMLMPVLVGMAFTGLGLLMSVVAAMTCSQRIAPPQMRGRVAAIVGLVLFGPQILFQGAGALLISHTGYRVLFVVVAAGSTLVAGYGLLRASPRE